MKLLDSGIRVFVLAHGTGVRWLREDLNSLKVKTPLTDGCLDELVREADRAAWRAFLSGSGDPSYLTYFRQELATQAALVERWTASDDKIPSHDEIGEAFVRIARKYALPRPWKLTDPVAVESRRLRPSHWKWATGFDARSMAQGSPAQV